MRRLLATAAALAVLAVACSPSPAFDEDDLEALVLQADEAPEEMLLVADQSGAIAIEDLTQDETQLGLFTEEGLISGFDSVYATPGLAGVPGEPIGRVAMIIDSSAYLYESPDGAEMSFARLQREIPDSFDGIGTLFPFEVSDLGEEAFALRVELTRPGIGLDVGVLYSWRIENLILRLVVFGAEGIEDAEVRGLADAMHAHAATE